MKVTTRSSGNITMNSVNWANLDTGMDITLAAQVGDTLEASLFALIGNQAVDTYFDVATIVAAAPVNSFVKRGAVTTAPPPYGNWYALTGAWTNLGVPIHYTVVTGDLSSGLVTLRLRYATLTATNRTFHADGTNYTAEFCVKNLGPVDST